MDENRNKTIWMGNIPFSFKESDILQLLDIINVHPVSLVVKSLGEKLKYAFIVVDSEDVYDYILNKCNGIKINDYTFDFKTASSLEEKKEIKKSFMKYTLFVGNVDKSISQEEFAGFFLKKFKSIISVKLIMENPKKSKGYGFVEFLNYKEYKRPLKKWKDVYLGKQKLVFGYSKNRYKEKNSFIQRDRRGIKGLGYNPTRAGTEIGRDSIYSNDSDLKREGWFEYNTLINDYVNYLDNEENMREIIIRAFNYIKREENYPGFRSSNYYYYYVKFCTSV